MSNKIIKLKDGSDYLYPYANFMAIDTSNVIASNPSSPYTAVQDCFARGYMDGGYININGTQVFYGGGEWHSYNCYSTC